MKIRLGSSITRWSTRRASASRRWEIFTEWLHPSPAMLLGERRIWAVIPARSSAAAVRWA